MSPLRCSYCRCFMRDGYVYAPWGTYEMTEPPEDEFICDKCFTPERKRILDLMWHPPTRLHKGGEDESNK